MTNSLPGAAAEDLRRENVTIGAIGGAHFTSHCLQLALAPLLPLIAADFKIGFSELGVLLTLFYAVSGVGQVVAGVMVDRLGAHRLLLAGLVLQSAAVIGMGFASNYLWFFPLVVVAGLGNTVYHPADFSILSRKIRPGRLGRAFAVHQASGSIGFAAWPLAATLVAVNLHWRFSLFVAGALGIAVALYLVLNLPLLVASAADNARQRRDGPGPAKAVPFIQVLMMPAVGLGFAYFALSSIGFASVQTFGIATLSHVYGTALETAGVIVFAYVFASTAGIGLGGYLADRLWAPHGTVATTVVGGAAVAFFLAWAFAGNPVLFVIFLVASGLLGGVAGPSRDILVRRASPEGSIGRVFGTVYSGIDAGGVLNPFLYAVLLDAGAGRYVFLAGACLWALAFVPIAILGRQRPPAG